MDCRISLGMLSDRHFRSRAFAMPTIHRFSAAALPLWQLFLSVISDTSLYYISFFWVMSLCRSRQSINDAP